MFLNVVVRVIVVVVALVFAVLVVVVVDVVIYVVGCLVVVFVFVRNCLSTNNEIRRTITIRNTAEGGGHHINVSKVTKK